MKCRSQTKAHGDHHLAFGSSRAGTTLGRHLGESYLAKLPLTYKRRRSPVRRPTRTTFYNIREERTVMNRRLQASKSIHESS